MNRIHRLEVERRSKQPYLIWGKRPPSHPILTNSRVETRSEIICELERDTPDYSRERCWLRYVVITPAQLHTLLDEDDDIEGFWLIFDAIKPRDSDGDGNND